MALIISEQKSDDIKSSLQWQLKGSRSQGRPCSTWDGKLVAFCAENAMGHWMEAAKDKQAWKSLRPDFIAYAAKVSE